MARIGREFIRHILPQIIRPIRTLWNEMIGFVFLCLAVVPIPRTFRDYRQYTETGEGLFRVVLSTQRTDYVVTNDLAQNDTQATQQACGLRWKIEQFHREAKQATGLKSCQCRSQRAPRNHIACAMLV